MQRMMIEKAKEYLASGKVDRVLGWEQGEHSWDRTPAFFTAENIDKLNSISKILLEKERIEGEEFEMLMNDQAVADA